MSVCVHSHQSQLNFPDMPNSSTGLSPDQQVEQMLKRLEHLFSSLKQSDDNDNKVKPKTNNSRLSHHVPDSEPQHKPKTNTPKSSHHVPESEPEHKSTKKTQPSSAPPSTEVPSGTKPSRNQPMPEPTGIVDVDKPIIVKAGETFDGGGKYYRPTKAMGDGSQDEHQQPVFILEPGATLKNVQYSGGDGIHLIGDATLDHVTNRDIGEDAITIDGEKNRIHDAKLSGMSVDDIPKGPAKVVITNSSFYNGSDKVVQDNGDAEVLMRNVYVNGAGKLFRTNGGQPITTKLTVEDSTFENIKESLFRTDSKTSSASFSNVDDGGMKVVALTPDAATIKGTDKISYKPYSG